MKHLKTLTISLINGILVFTLAGCANLMSSKMPQGSITMTEAYNNAINGTEDVENVGNYNSLQPLRTEVSALGQQNPNYSSYTRTQENEITSQFPRLPNPNIVMYVFPHEAGIGDTVIPIPGYSTVFPFYTQVQYAMPDEILPSS